MALNPETLAEALRQHAELGRALDAQDRALVEAWVRAWQVIEDELRDLIEQITAGDATMSRLLRQRRIAQALELVTTRLHIVLSAAGVIADKGATELIAAAGGDAAALIATQLPPGVSLQLLQADAEQLAQIIARTAEQITARHYWLQAEAIEAVKAELVRSVAAGTNPREAARKMVEAVQGVFNGGLHRARVIARTEQIDAYRNAAYETHWANRDLLTGWQWTADLSERTCRSCLAMHGSLHPLDEPGPLDHQQGRCVRVPITKSWRDLGFDVPEPEPLVKPGDGERWLQDQPRGVQDHILGKQGADMWRAGGWPASDWSVRRTTEGWRPSYQAAKPPTD